VGILIIHDMDGKFVRRRVESLIIPMNVFFGSAVESAAN
jgi:hypothetical protein